MAVRVWMVLAKFKDAEHPLLDGLAGVGAGVGDEPVPRPPHLQRSDAGNALLHEEDAADGTAAAGSNAPPTMESTAGKRP